MSDTVTASDGTRLPIDSLAATITYSGSFVATIAVQYPNLAGIVKTYTQTYTNDGTNITAISQWVPS